MADRRERVVREADPAPGHTTTAAEQNLIATENRIAFLRAECEHGRALLDEEISRISTFSTTELESAIAEMEEVKARLDTALAILKCALGERRARLAVNN